MTFDPAIFAPKAIKSMPLRQDVNLPNRKPLPQQAQSRDTIAREEETSPLVQHLEREAEFGSKAQFESRAQAMGIPLQLIPGIPKGDVAAEIPKKSIASIARKPVGSPEALKRPPAPAPKNYGPFAPPPQSIAQHPDPLHAQPARFKPFEPLEPKDEFAGFDLHAYEFHESTKTESNLPKATTERQKPELPSRIEQNRPADHVPEEELDLKTYLEMQRPDVEKLKAQDKENLKNWYDQAGT